MLVQLAFQQLEEAVQELQGQRCFGQKLLELLTFLGQDPKLFGQQGFHQLQQKQERLQLK
jgi:hypothetical protein